jgi:hypothetical protein
VPLTVQQLITLCCQEANAPAFTAQAGQKLNLILNELPQDYDLVQTQGWLSGIYQNAPSFTSTPLAGNILGSTITFATSCLAYGWKPGMTVTDTGGLLPANTSVGFISGDGLTVLLQNATAQIAVAASTADTFTAATGGIGRYVNSANVVSISGPFALPPDFLRMDYGDFFWQNGGINYFPIPYDINEFDAFVQQPGFTSYPTAFAVDTSTTPYGLYIWPASSGAYPYFGRYERQLPDVDTPATSTSVPWFPGQQYLQRRLTAEVMGLTGDTRWKAYMVDAEEILNRYLKKEGNRSNRTSKVKLDQRTFGPRWTNLHSTKEIPW